MRRRFGRMCGPCISASCFGWPSIHSPSSIIVIERIIPSPLSIQSSFSRELRHWITTLEGKTCVHEMKGMLSRLLERTQQIANITSQLEDLRKKFIGNNRAIIGSLCLFEDCVCGPLLLIRMYLLFYAPINECVHLNVLRWHNRNAIVVKVT